jgi:hypothetical protein
MALHRAPTISYQCISRLSISLKSRSN